MRYLAHAVLHAGKVYRSSIVELHPLHGVIIESFSGEEAGVTYISGIIAVVSDTRLTDAMRRQLAHMVRNAPLVEDSIRRIRRYLDDNALYPAPGDTPRLLLLPRK